MILVRSIGFSSSPRMAGGGIVKGIHVRWVLRVLFAVLLPFLSSSCLLAQNPYLEPMGGTEVELYYHLDQSAGLGMQRIGEEVAFRGSDLNAKYKISRGKVVEVDFDQLFTTKAEATSNFEKSLRYLRDQGLIMNVIPTSQHARIMRGEGSGMRASLVMVPCPKGYRVEATVSELH